MRSEYNRGYEKGYRTGYYDRIQKKKPRFNQENDLITSRDDLEEYCVQLEKKIKDLEKYCKQLESKL